MQVMVYEHEGRGYSATYDRDTPTLGPICRKKVAASFMNKRPTSHNYYHDQSYI